MKQRWAFLVILLISASRALEKHWQGNVDWQNPSNWLGGFRPELDSRVIFPMEMRHAVGLPRDKVQLRITGLELPRDGVVALPEFGKLSMSEAGEGAHQSKASHWLRDTPFFWVDPLNWNGSSEAVPHLERLPCQSDLVVLPASSETFSLRLPATRDLEVRAVRLADENSSLARWEWRRALTDRPEFFGIGYTVKYSPLMGCDDCHCQEGDLSRYWEEICNVQRPRCAALPACEYPLKVEGHCCYYCGGRIRLSKKTLLSTARRVAKTVLKAYKDTLLWHSRPTWDGYSEILITEKNAYRGTSTIIATSDVVAALKEEEVEVVYSETSGGPLYDYRLAVALAPFLGGFLALLFLLLLLFPIFGYSYSQVWQTCREVGAAICIETHVNGRKKKSFAFAKFENVQEGSVQLAEEEDTSTQSTAQGERFENPLYKLKESRTVGGQEKKVDPNEPVSLIALERASQLDRIEEIEMDIENL